MITRDDLAPRVKATVEYDAAALDSAIAVAVEAVNDYIGLSEDGLTAAKTWRPMSAATLNECYLRAATTQFKFAANGSGSYVTNPDGSMVPGQPNDVLQKAYAILKKYVNRV